MKMIDEDLFQLASYTSTKKKNEFYIKIVIYIDLAKPQGTLILIMLSALYGYS